MQGRSEVRWRPEQEASLASPCLKLRSFESKYTVLKKVPVTLLGFFGVPIDLGIVSPFPPHYNPGQMRCCSSNAASPYDTPHNSNTRVFPTRLRRLLLLLRIQCFVWRITTPHQDKLCFGATSRELFYPLNCRTWSNCLQPLVHAPVLGNRLYFSQPYPTDVFLKWRKDRFSVVRKILQLW